jgi:hypothetical protein
MNGGSDCSHRPFYIQEYGLFSHPFRESDAETDADGGQDSSLDYFSSSEDSDTEACSPRKCQGRKLVSTLSMLKERNESLLKDVKALTDNLSSQLWPTIEAMQEHVRSRRRSVASLVAYAALRNPTGKYLQA